MMCQSSGLWRVVGEGTGKLDHSGSVLTKLSRCTDRITSPAVLEME